MKKIKLFALAAFAMLSTNASAVELLTKFSGANGVEYQIVKAYTPAAGFNDAVPGEVVVVSYSQSATTTAVVIPATISNTNSALIDDVPLANVYNVVGIAGYKDQYKDTDADGIAEQGEVVANGDAQVTVFVGCQATSITLPASVQFIGHNAFEGCDAATIELPAQSRLIEIGTEAFKGAKNLATFATGNAGYLASVGNNAFYGCAALTEFTASQYLVNIGAGAFIGTGITKLDLSTCKNFDSVNKGASVLRWFTGTAVDADKTNSKLTQVILPTALADTDNDSADPAEERLTIAANAFDGCTALVTIGTTANSFEIPAYVSSIGDEAFKGTGVTKFDLSKNAEIKSFSPSAAGKEWFTKTVANTSTSTLQQIILNKAFDGSAGKTYTIAATDLANISTLAKIGSNDTNAEYQLPKGVSLVAGMFEGTGLTKLDLSKYDGVDYALPALFGAGIATLTEVVLNEKTTELAAEAFGNCTALATLNNIAKLKKIGDGAFYRTAIAEFAFGADLAAKFGGTNGTPFTPATPLKETDGLTEKPYSTATTLSIDLSKSVNVTTIEASAFKNMAMLTSVKLHNDITTIGASAFEGTGITTIELPASLVQNADATTKPNVLATATRNTLGLGANAFKDCKSLTTVSFEPAAVTGTIFAYDGIYDDAGTAGVDEKTYNVFRGCNLVTFATSTEYSALFDGNTATATTHPIPVNVKMDKAVSKTINTKLDKKTKGYAMKGFYDTANDYKIKIADVTTVYEAYINDGDVVLSRLKKIGQYYEIPAGLAVIVRTSEEKEVVPIKAAASTANGSSLLTIAGNALKSVAADNTDKEEANYIYALTNKEGEGFAFSFYTGSKFNNGHIYVVSPKAPSASGRLNIVFLDEDGNIEDEATAIQSIEKKAENNGVRYNLAGQKVNASYKGVVIKDGKKYIQK